jgi:hypothetical protein
VFLPTPSVRRNHVKRRTLKLAYGGILPPPWYARPLGGPRVSSAAGHRLGCLIRGTTRPRLCTPVACTCQVLVYLLRAPPTGGTHSASRTHLLARRQRLVWLLMRIHALCLGSTHAFECTFACAPPPTGECGGVTGSDLSPPPLPVVPMAPYRLANG